MCNKIPTQRGGAHLESIQTFSNGAFLRNSNSSKYAPEGHFEMADKPVFMNLLNNLSIEVIKGASHLVQHIWNTDLTSR